MCKSEASQQRELGHNMSPTASERQSDNNTVATADTGFPIDAQIQSGNVSTHFLAGAQIQAHLTHGNRYSMKCQNAATSCYLAEAAINHLLIVTCV